MQSDVNDWDTKNLSSQESAQKMMRIGGSGQAVWNRNDWKMENG
jgi:hypothetical protein